MPATRKTLKAANVNLNHPEVKRARPIIPALPPAHVGATSSDGNNRVAACAGCALRHETKDGPAPIPRKYGGAMRPLLLTPSSTQADLNAWDFPGVQEFVRSVGMDHDVSPLLRCPQQPKLLSHKFRGSKPRDLKLQTCTLPHLKGLGKRLLVPLGPMAYAAAAAHFGVVKKAKYAEVWGTYVEWGDQLVYVASDWAQGPLMEPRMIAVDLMRIRKRPEPAVACPTYRVTPEEFKDAVESLSAADLRRWGPPAGDIETPGFSPYVWPVRCVGIAHPLLGAISMPIHYLDGTPVPSAKPKAVKKALKALGRIGVIWHNQAFDHRWLWYHYGYEPTGKVWDTMTVHRHIYERAPHSLAIACSMEFSTGGWKDGLNHGLLVRNTSTLLQYNGQDCVNTYKLLQILAWLYMQEYGSRVDGLHMMDINKRSEAWNGHYVGKGTPIGKLIGNDNSIEGDFARVTGDGEVDEAEDDDRTEYSDWEG